MCASGVSNYISSFDKPVSQRGGHTVKTCSHIRRSDDPEDELFFSYVYGDDEVTEEDSYDEMVENSGKEDMEVEETESDVEDTEPDVESKEEEGDEIDELKEEDCFY